MPMSAEIKDATEETAAVDAQKRAFLKKFGRYATAGAGMATLMSPTLSSANNYERGRLIFHSYNKDGKLKVEGGFNNDENSAGGSFSTQYSNPSWLSGGIGENRIPERKIIRWYGNWNIKENGDFSGYGTVHKYYRTNSPVGEWTAQGHGYAGRYTIVWND